MHQACAVVLNRQALFQYRGILPYACHVHNIHIVATLGSPDLVFLGAGARAVNSGCAAGGQGQACRACKGAYGAAPLPGSPLQRSLLEQRLLSADLRECCCLLFTSIAPAVWQAGSTGATLSSAALPQMSRLDAEAALESVCQLNSAAAPALKSMEGSMQAALQAADALHKRHKRASIRPRLLQRFLGRA